MCIHACAPTCDEALLARPEVWGVCVCPGIRSHRAGGTGASRSAGAGPRADGAATVDSHGSCFCKRRPYTFKCDEKPSEEPLFLIDLFKFLQKPD